ncbi:hypothetical protein GCM10011519_11910 [Marmoricola endophyticus]|uniref:Cobalamin-independent methionine synthase MetE C-terminal/archaeal domain-containing protein n=1 Tax=Marmoricola endophyticus TaxID=2040280 RepID=A0A917F0G0_9ACTN|nr:methionine synthase [Marmoricola endophyticus]GGF39869.1 hypothetical protein GCM10011519_11910 [Marmoricola endophyticus]
MVWASGVGSMPGGEVGGSGAADAGNAASYTEAVRTVLGELDLPYVPELPARGAMAGLTGRAAGLLSVVGLGADLQPAGWRLTGSSDAGLDQRRARSLLAQDLDTVEDLGQGLEGPFKAQLCGPWTLAATLERPRGDRMLADHGARRDLAQAWAEAAASHVGDLRRRFPGVELLLQLDEPALPAVLAGSVPTASGFGRHRTVHPPEASEALGLVTAAVAAAGATPLVHCCAAEVPSSLIRGAGALGLSIDVTRLAPESYDGVAAAVEAGEWVLLGVVDATDPARGDDRVPTERAERFLDMLGLAPAERTVVTPTCGLAGASTSWARQALGQARATARRLSPEPE